MADINTLSTVALSEEGIWMDVFNLEDEPVLFDGKPLRLKLLGSNSEKLKAISRRNQLHYLKQARKGKNFDETDIERSERVDLDRAVAATVEWENVPLDGALAECTSQNVRKAYQTYNVLLSRVVEWIGDESRFTKGSSANSPTGPTTTSS